MRNIEELSISKLKKYYSKKNNKIKMWMLLKVNQIQKKTQDENDFKNKRKNKAIIKTAKIKANSFYAFLMIFHQV